RALAAAVVVREVLDADEARLRAAERAPEPDAAQLAAPALDLPEEVVRGEKEEVAAEVAVALDDVVRVLGHVLGVSWEDDEVVQLPHPVAARDALEVVVREHVRLALRQAEPAHERAVV